MTVKKRVLVTAFEAFAGASINPTQVIIEKLEPQAELELKTLVLPVVFDECLVLLEEAMAEFKPDVVLALGQAGGRSKISLERVAINLNDARMPDNAGQQPIDTCVCEGAPDAYFSRLPIKRLFKALSEDAIPVEVGKSAGTYVCNHLMFGLLDRIEHRYPNMQGGFIHVPYLPEQSPLQMPSLSLDVMLRAIEKCIEVCVETTEEIKLTAGTLH